MGFPVFPYFSPGPPQIEMDRFVRAVLDTGPAHFAELVAGHGHGKKTHRAAFPPFIPLETDSRSALGRADLVVGPQFHGGET